MMAVIGGKVSVVGSEDGVVVVKKEIILDPETGLLLEVEHIKAAVDIGGGNIAIREQKRIRGIAMVKDNNYFIAAIEVPYSTCYMQIQNNHRL